MKIKIKINKEIIVMYKKITQFVKIVLKVIQQILTQVIEYVAVIIHNATLNKEKAIKRLAKEYAIENLSEFINLNVERIIKQKIEKFIEKNTRYSMDTQKILEILRKIIKE